MAADRLPIPRSARTAALLLPLLALLAWSAWGAEFKLRDFSARIDGERMRVSFRVDYRFSDTALDALDNGVPLSLDLHLQVQRENAWIWDPRPVDRHLRYSIRYHALAELYQVVDHQSGERRNFATRNAAIDFLGRIDDQPLVALAELDRDRRYELHVRAALDVEALPLPLRPLAYLNPDWKLASEWVRWPLPR